MPCYHPWKAPRRNSQGRRYIDLPEVTLPCGQCIGCRLDRSRDWATRIHHESTLHQDSTFLTLTYSDEHLPADYSLQKRTFQLFMKRLRKSIPEKIRFYACGEYGGHLLRPHYHAIIFGHGFPDKTPWRQTDAGYLTYRSAKLEACWELGHAEIGTVSIESAGYVARYVVEKRTGDQAKHYYDRIHPATGELWTVTPEFALQSRRPGIGRGWFDRFQVDAFPDDFVVVNGSRRAVPRYYKKLLEAQPCDSFVTPADRITWERKSRALAHADNNTPERLAVREEVQTIKAASLKRSLESDS